MLSQATRRAAVQGCEALRAISTSATAQLWAPVDAFEGVRPAPKDLPEVSFDKFKSMVQSGPVRPQPVPEDWKAWAKSAKVDKGAMFAAWEKLYSGSWSNADPETMTPNPEEKLKEIRSAKGEWANAEAKYEEAVKMPAEPDWASMATSGKMFPEFIAEVKKIYQEEAASVAKKPSEDELIAAQAEDIKRAHAAAKAEVALFQKKQNEQWKIAARSVKSIEVDEWLYGELENGRNVSTDEVLYRQPELRQAIDDEISDYQWDPSLASEAAQNASKVIDVPGMARLKKFTEAKAALDAYVRSKAK
ncbi:unnamed protein product [Pedinophyceae sp. YPF-701]|nr:unnamed protein product [Pedinophyceae sp. YPF-701]